MAEHGATAQADSFRAVLFPHRSLGPAGFVVLMTALGVASFATGMAFLAMGAWPVVGFLGLDVVLVYVAFRLNYRSGRRREVIDLTPERLTLTRVHPSGQRESFDFNPCWVRVNLARAHDGRNRIELASHGRGLVFGTFLTDDERTEFAAVLEEALVQARGGPRI